MIRPFLISIFLHSLKRSRPNPLPIHSSDKSILTILLSSRNILVHIFSSRFFKYPRMHLFFCICFLLLFCICFHILISNPFSSPHYIAFHQIILTHCDQDKITTILQTMFWNSFSWTTPVTFVFWFEFHWMFPSDSIDGLVPNMWQDVIWTNDDIVCWRIYASMG